MRINLYAQNRHVVIVDGIPLSGFADGDWLEVSPEGNEATRTHGGDGPAMNISSDQGGTINISLQPTSPAIGDLLALREEQKNNPRMFSIQVVTGVEETVSASGCAFGKLPGFRTGGPTMQGRQFAFECLKIKLDTSAVLPIDGGMLGGALF